MAESEEELKSLLKKVKQESEKVGLKLNIQKTKVMVSGHITSQKIDGETMETLTNFVLGAPESLQMMTAAMKLKDNLLIGRKADITLPTKVQLVKALVFPVVMYGCESWTIKKAECRRTNAFELWCCRRLLRVP